MPPDHPEHSTLYLVQGDSRDLILNSTYKAEVDKATSLKGLNFSLNGLLNALNKDRSELLGLSMEISMRISILEVAQNALDGSNPSNVTYINPSTNRAVVVPNNLEQLEGVMGVMQFVYKDEYSGIPTVYTNSNVIDNDPFFIKLKRLVKDISNERKRQGRALDIDLGVKYIP